MDKASHIRSGGSRALKSGTIRRERNDNPKVAMIAFNLACYASVTARLEGERKTPHAIELDSGIRGSALDEKICIPCGSTVV